MRYLGLISSDARGQNGGQVATRSRAGTVLRTNARPVQKRSAAQLTHRQWVAYVSAKWRTLPAVIQQGWNTTAQQVTFTNSLGQPYHPTGFNLFRHVNMARVLFGGNNMILGRWMPQTVPALKSVSIEPIPFNGQLAAIGLYFSPSPTPAGVFLRVDATPVLSKGTLTPPAKRMRIIYTPTTQVASGVNILGGWAKAFGQGPEHGTIFATVRLCLFATGQYSPPLTVSATF